MSRAIGTLAKIKPLHAPLIPDPRWKIAGATPDNRPLYEEVSKRSRGVPELDDEGEKKMKKLREKYPDNPNGSLSSALLGSKAYHTLRRGPHRQWKTHPVNNEPLLPKNRLELYTLTRTFFLESQGNGNVQKTYWTPPTPEELAALKRDDKILEMGRAMATALVDSDITPAEMVEMIRSGKAIREVSEEQEGHIRETGEIRYPEPDVEYPQMIKPKQYRLSNGDEFKGKKAEAEAAELEVMQAREDARATEGY